MKEAAGEANMTVITIVLIAIVLGVGTIVVNSLMESTKNKSCCSSLGGEIVNGSCVWTRIDGTEASAKVEDGWTNEFCPE